LANHQNIFFIINIYRHLLSYASLFSAGLVSVGDAGVGSDFSESQVSRIGSCGTSAGFSSYGTFCRQSWSNSQLWNHLNSDLSFITQHSWWSPLAVILVCLSKSTRPSSFRVFIVLRAVFREHCKFLSRSSASMPHSLPFWLRTRAKGWSLSHGAELRATS
jgi:hypothetical protein